MFYGKHFMQCVCLEDDQEKQNQVRYLRLWGHWGK